MGFTSLQFTSSSFPSLSLSLSLSLSPSTDQLELTLLLEPSMSHGTIISSSGPKGLLIITSVLNSELKNIKNGIFKKFKNSKMTPKTPKNQKVNIFKKSLKEASNQKSLGNKI